MRTVLKWFGIAAVIVVALVIFVVAVTYIYNPRAHFAWVKPGIAQRKIPAGVDASVVFENVNVIPMDSERVLEGQSVAIEDHRIAGIGNSGDIDIPADAHVVDGEGRFLVPGLSDMIVHTDGSENDLLVYLANGVTTIRIMGEDPPAILEWRDQIKAGTRAGPNIWVWWPQYVHPGVFDGQGWGPGANRYVEFGTGYLEYLADHEKMLLALYESGALLMSGTDVPVPLMVPGFSLHDEFETMADIGLSAYDVLRTSTYNPALYLGELEEFGTVEEGKRADLVLLDANPLEEITNARQIAGVVVRGRWYSHADLDLMLEAVAKDYEAAKTTQTVVEIAFPVVMFLLMVALVWFVARRVRRRKANQISS